MRLQFEAANTKALLQQIYEFLDETVPDWPVVSGIGKQPVDLDNRHPHGNVPRETSDEQTQPGDTSEVPTDDDMIAATKACMSRLKNKDKVMAILVKHGATTRATEIPDENRAAALEELNG